MNVLVSHGVDVVVRASEELEVPEECDGVTDEREAEEARWHPLIGSPTHNDVPKFIPPPQHKY